MTRSDAERFADILNAIDRCQDYAQYDAVLHNLGASARRFEPIVWRRRQLP